MKTLNKTLIALALVASTSIAFASDNSMNQSTAGDIAAKGDTSGEMTFSMNFGMKAKANGNTANTFEGMGTGYNTQKASNQLHNNAESNNNGALDGDFEGTFAMDFTGKGAADATGDSKAQGQGLNTLDVNADKYGYNYNRTPYYAPTAGKAASPIQ